MFCNKLGYRDGNQWHPKESPSYDTDAFRVGKCKETDTSLMKCTGGCNDYKIGGVCDDNWKPDILPTVCSKGVHVAIKISCLNPTNTTSESSCIGIYVCSSMRGSINYKCIIHIPIYIVYLLFHR